ncbi:MULTISPECIES: NADH-quinone oxidoreductase subunit C [unclassified Crossiella]|uniref:NADH-quinone oxidoreductase subunit C n=1 Tax=unclassified Crossiella TaxID=2620835 RepID=UPI001FFEBB2B|nr:MULTISPECIES: NADH-quinone oxidoreductase subunit C [unclassified Crossiella]MCK2236805.1 NADH-quinone oxidoreductase subunit C [Crossiella sp. S99.2]MCK2250473.1 NADH-quinone oxidoreductase subunit C [Crossiella sp. S99.1]
MTSLALAGELAALLPEITVKTAFGQSTAHVPVAAWASAARQARDELGCVLFDWLGAEDAGRPGALGGTHAVTLHVLRPGPWAGLLLRTEVPAGEALPSVAAVWAGAAWHEREAAEMFGLDLAEHPDPRRLLLPDSFSGHPLRKDFVLAARVVRPWPGALEPGEDGTGAPSRRRIAPPGVPGPEWGPRRDEGAQ